MPDFSLMDDAHLKQFILNYQRQGAQGKPLYAEAVSELDRRRAGGLDLEKTIALVREAAREERCISYGDIATANGMAWDKARYPMNYHLGRLIEEAKERGWPMLSAVIVNKANITSREMDPSTLEGFVAAARSLGHKVDDPKEFLKRQQELCFGWARSQVQLGKTA